MPGCTFGPISYLLHQTIHRAWKKGSIRKNSSGLPPFPPGFDATGLPACAMTAVALDACFSNAHRKSAIGPGPSGPARGKKNWPANSPPDAQKGL